MDEPTAPPDGAEYLLIAASVVAVLSLLYWMAQAAFGN